MNFLMTFLSFLALIAKLHARRRHLWDADTVSPEVASSSAGTVRRSLEEGFEVKWHHSPQRLLYSVLSGSIASSLPCICKDALHTVFTNLHTAQLQKS